MQVRRASCALSVKYSLRTGKWSHTQTEVRRLASPLAMKQHGRSHKLCCACAGNRPGSVSQQKRRWGIAHFHFYLATSALKHCYRLEKSNMVSGQGQLSLRSFSFFPSGSNKMSVGDDSLVGCIVQHSTCVTNISWCLSVTVGVGGG